MEVGAREVAVARDEYGNRTDARNRSAVIDAMRAIAALMVVFAHSAFVATRGDLHTEPKLLHLAKLAGPGVLLFFVLSGYLIAGPFIRALIRGEPLPHTAPYLVRRVARIYPAYWVAFAAVLITLAPVGGVHAYQYPVHFLLLQSSWPHAGEPTAIFFVAWTLGIEAAFYLFVPCAAWALRKLRPGPWAPGRLALVLVAAGIASGVWSVIAPTVIAGPRFTHAQLLARIGLQVWLFAFVPGMLLGVKDTIGAGPAFVRFVDRFFGRVWAWTPLFVALWATAYAADSASPGTWHNLAGPLYSLASGAFIAAFIGAGPSLHRLVRPLAAVGLVSYGIYLWHSIVVNLLNKHGEIGVHGGYAAHLVDFLLVLALTLPLATMSWFVFERPFMRRAADWARRHRERAAAGQPPAGAGLGEAGSGVPAAVAERTPGSL